MVLMCWYQKLKKKYYFDVFSSENNFKKQPQPHSQTPSYKNWNWS